MTDVQAPILPRGAVAMGILIQKMMPLVEYIIRFVPDCKSVCVLRDDYDYIQRWPKAGEHYGLTYEHGDAYLYGLLIYPDNKPSTMYRLHGQTVRRYRP